MKLRIKGSTLRLRLSQSEVDRIQEGFEVQDTVYFGEEVILRYTFAIDNIDNPTAKFEKDNIYVCAPKNKVIAWCKDDDEVGFDYTINHGDGTSLYMLIEKDFKCLTERGEDESDLYENPESENRH